MMMSTNELQSVRLRLVAATLENLAADLAGPATLARHFSVLEPVGWPPQFYDEAAVRYTITMLDHPANHGWCSFYLIADTGLVGIVGYKGPPDASGTVELGYGLIPSAQGKGYATEATHTLVDHAFTFPAVRRVIAETMPALTPSIGVLERAGFRLIGPGSERGVIRFELTREDVTAGRRTIGPHVRTLARLQGHMAWANQQALTAIEQAKEGRVSAIAMLGHILGAEHVWLARMAGQAPSVAVCPELTLAECRTLAAQNELALRQLIFSVSPAELQRTITYHTSLGDEYVSTVEDILLHLCLHGTYHRGQIAQQQRRDQQLPGPSDYIAFARGAAAASRTPGDRTPGATR
jgi:RimJ/RimL family protein N-acetyltransferase/uncharacterized damage-inducible protein DinB